MTHKPDWTRLEAERKRADERLFDESEQRRLVICPHCGCTDVVYDDDRNEYDGTLISAWYECNGCRECFDIQEDEL